MKYDLEKRIFLFEKYIKFEKISTVQHAYISFRKNSYTRKCDLHGHISILTLRFLSVGSSKGGCLESITEYIGRTKSKHHERNKKNPKNVLNSVFLSLEKRCKEIISAEGGHIEIK